MAVGKPGSPRDPWGVGVFSIIGRPIVRTLENRFFFEPLMCQGPCAPLWAKVHGPSYGPESMGPSCGPGSMGSRTRLWARVHGPILWAKVHGPLGPHIGQVPWAQAFKLGAVASKGESLVQ